MGRADSTKAEKKFESVKQYAEKRGVSTKKIYELCEDPASGFPHLRFGTRIIIPVDEADAWARKQSE